MSRLVAAPDKFRGTATAAQVAAAAARAARAAGWAADEVPMADGGEGTLEAVGGEPRRTVVSGPLGRPVEAEWRLVTGPGGEAPTAVIESARAAGRQLLLSPTGDEPARATTAGVGELILAAVDAGAARVVVGLGGSATTDGGWGAVEIIGSRAWLGGAEVTVACDVRTAFLEAARVFGPQKGATPDQVSALTARLGELSQRYRADFGVDVDRLVGAGAAGGLAGGLAALGARLVPGFELVAELTHLADRLAEADLVVTGEGHLDPPSFDGKVVGGVVSLVAGRAPVLCVVGDADAALAAHPPVTGPGFEVVSLTALAGPARARSETEALVAEVVGDRLSRLAKGG